MFLNLKNQKIGLSKSSNQSDHGDMKIHNCISVGVTIPAVEAALPPNNRPMHLDVAPLFCGILIVRRKVCSVDCHHKRVEGKSLPTCMGPFWVLAAVLE